jgi:hypothetical protein
MSSSSSRRRILLALAALLMVGAAAVWLLRPAGRANDDSTLAASQNGPPSASALVPRKPNVESTRPAHDSSRLLDDALQESDPGLRAMAFGSIFRDWVERDSEAALAYARRLPRDSAPRTAALLLLLPEIAKADAERALALAREMISNREQLAVYNVLFDQLAQGDVARAKRALDLVPAGEGRENAVRALATKWASRSFDEALAWAGSLNNTDERSAAVESALLVLSPNDALRAITLAQQFLSGPALERSLTGSLRRLTRHDPFAAASLVTQLPSGNPQTAAALDVARALATKEPETAINWIRTLPAGELQSLALNNVIDIWSAKDPATAKRYVSEMPAGAALDSASGQLARDLAATDPRAAIAWASDISNASAQDEAVVAIASTWARTDPADATRWAATLPTDSPARMQALKGALSYWALQDTAAAGAFVPLLSEAEQPAAIAAVAPALTRSDAAAALAWTQSLSNGDIRTLAIDAVVASWGDTAPDAAARWVATQQESPERVDHARAVVESWFGRDSKAASKWARSLPSGATRDGAIDMIASQLALKDPTLAWEMASMIDSPQLRAARLEQLRH